MSAAEKRQWEFLSEPAATLIAHQWKSIDREDRFVCKSGCVGFYFRGDTEHVLFAVRGELRIPAEQRERNWIEAPKRGHSVKPYEFFDRVERVSPGPRVELFARQPRLGWDHWGLGYEWAS